MWGLALAAAAVLVASYAAVRARRLTALVPAAIPLAWFFLLMAAATLVHIATALWVQDTAVLERQGAGLLDVLFWLHHALLLAALGAAVYPYVRQATVAAVAPVLLVAEPVLRGIEATVLLLLTARTAWNHHQRATEGSLRVAAAFLLLTLGHSVFLADAAPLGARSPWGEGAVLAGLVLLTASLPREP